MFVPVAIEGNRVSSFSAVNSSTAEHSALEEKRSKSKEIQNMVHCEF